MAKQALAVVLAPLLMGCLATDICTDADLSSDREPLSTNLLQIKAATDDMEDSSAQAATPAQPEWRLRLPVQNNHYVVLAPGAYDGTTWQDSSGNGRDFVASCAGSPSSVQMDDIDAVRFNGQKCLKTSQAHPVPQSLTIFAVVKWNGEGGHWDPIAAVSHDTYWSLRHYAGSNEINMHVRNEQSPRLLHDLDKYYIVVGRVDDASRQSYVRVVELSGSGDSSQVRSTQGIPSGGNEVITMGRATGIASEWLDGDIASFIIYDRALTDAEVDETVDFLKTGGTSASAPTSSPTDSPTVSPTVSPSGSPTGSPTQDPAYAYQNGPRVDNDFTQCSVWFGTLEEAKSMCDDAGDCRALHDWNCDGNNWRYCNVTASAMESAGNGTEACTMIKMEPTHAPTPTTVTAIGDPHLKNIKQESFEIRRAGVHTLLTVPRGAAAVDTLLKVGASVERVESGCSSLFIQSLDIMGHWLGSVPPLRFAAGIVLPGEVDGAVLQVGNSSALSIDEFLSKVPSSMITLTVPKKDIAMPNVTNKHATLMRAALKFGPGVRMKVSWTSERIPSASIAHSLWVSVAGLSTAHSTFGGLLGEDDHRDAATPDADCTEKGRSGMLLLGGKHESPEVAQASLE